ncbi:MAG: glycosyltransferase family 39 protein [Candidatus Omnitrophica bacterium]|nr:glycosyltransferase family 39 protein [Candidatus Omnitrophota bacterium]
MRASIRKQTLVTFLFIASLLSFHVINNLLWLSFDNSYSGCDVLNHLTRQLRFYYGMQNVFSMPLPCIEKIQRIFWLFRFSDNVSWPPFTYLVASFFNNVFGMSPLVSIMTNILYLGILVVATYSIGRQMADIETGFLAAFFVSLYPAIYGLSRKFGLDLPLSALVAFSMQLFFINKSFHNRYICILLGIVMGCGTLIKIQYLIFVSVPFFYVSLPVFIRLYKSRKRKLNRVKTLYLNRGINVIICLGIAAVICGWWLLSNIGLILKSLFAHSSGNIETIDWQLRASLSGGRWLLFYVLTIIKNISPIFAVTFILSLMFLRKSKLKNKRLFLLWLIIPWIFFTFLPVKRERYLLAILPVFALISALGIARIKRSEIKKLLGVGLGFIGMLQLFVCSYGINDFNCMKTSMVHVPQKNNAEEITKYFFNDTALISGPIVRIIWDDKIVARDTVGLLEYYTALCFFPERLAYSECIDDFKAIQEPHFLIIPEELFDEGMVARYKLLKKALLKPGSVRFLLCQSVLKESG